jgi:hypothetical protein
MMRFDRIGNRLNPTSPALLVALFRIYSSLK